MADADEDVIPRPGIWTDDSDLTDEAQDFRFLASISYVCWHILLSVANLVYRREGSTIPKRGEKDFESHGTTLQTNTLAASREAMHNALSFQRVHQPRGHNTAMYHPETNMAYIHNPQGPHFVKMGHVKTATDDPIGNDELRGKRLWLLPEEVIYLLERGALDVRWPPSEDDESDDGLPMSLQAAYAMFITDEEPRTASLTLERYNVYGGLKRQGYTVLRAPSWHSPGPALGRYPLTRTASMVLPAAPVLGREVFAPRPQRTWNVGLLEAARWWYALVSDPDASSVAEQEAGPLVTPRLYRSYNEIYRRLSLINFHDPTSQFQPLDPQEPPTEPGLHVTYHVWKPGSQTYKKSAPGPPDFRVVVVNARDTATPTLEQLNNLLETVPYDPPDATSQLYQRLKYGYKSVLLAIVDQGVVSYLRVADAAFGGEKLYQKPGRPRGGKRGGGRGRGRGR